MGISRLIGRPAHFFIPITGRRGAGRRTVAAGNFGHYNDWLKKKNGKGINGRQLLDSAKALIQKNTK
jgi:hypothetical protein